MSAESCSAELSPSEHKRVAHKRHELRTPLNAILGYAEMLLEESDGTLSAEVVSALQKIIGTANGIVKLIDQLTHLKQDENSGARSQTVYEILIALEDVVRLVGTLQRVGGFSMEFSEDLVAIETASEKLRMLASRELSQAI